MDEHLYRSRPMSPGDTLGRYELTRALGAGQMGEVFEAIAPDGSLVALKVLRDVGAVPSGDLHARFLREAKLCVALKNPHIVPVLDYGMADGALFVVMRRLRGRDLEAWLSETGPLIPEIACALVLQACMGLQAAHAAGIVHRDLKPANVFLDEADDGTVTAVICDFGVAKALDEDGSLTASGVALGTPLFMAPEQFFDAKYVDTRCDVWALGMTLYEALAGRSAFSHLRSMADLMVALRTLDVPPVQSFAPWISPSLARVVHSTLLQREARQPSAADFAEAIRAWGSPPAHVRVSDLVPASKAMREHVAIKAMLPKHYTELEKVDARTLATTEISTPEVDAQIGRTLAGRHRIVKKLGVGGMGAVYEAIDPSGRHVALKMMHAVSGAHNVEALRRFVREARAVQSISNPHVVSVFDSGIDESTGAPFFVMELLRGADLSSWMERHGALEPDIAAALFLQACEGLRAVHSAGLVHRDIKPSNLFVHEEDDGRLVVKVCDFGIAKQLGVGESTSELTSTGGLLGSPLYMSPEQAKSAKHVDERSDIYSLALSLHEALSGRRPWGGKTAIGEIIVAICTEDPPSLADAAPWCSAELAKTVHRGMARDSAARFSTVEEFASALRPFARDAALYRADVVAVPATARAASTERSPRHGGSGTARGLSVSTKTQRPAAASSHAWPVLIAATVALGGAGAWLGRGLLTAPEISTHALSSPPSKEQTSEQPPTSQPAQEPPSASISAASAAPVASSPQAEPTAPAARAHSDALITPRASQSQKAGATPAVQAPIRKPSEAPTSQIKGVGRGNTATELPD